MMTLFIIFKYTCTSLLKLYLRPPISSIELEANFFRLCHKRRKKLWTWTAYHHRRCHQHFRNIHHIHLGELRIVSLWPFSFCLLLWFHLEWYSYSISHNLSPLTGLGTVLTVTELLHPHSYYQRRSYYR